MRIALLFLALSCFVYGSTSFVEISVDHGLQMRLTGRIVNGTKAELRQFPYQVSLTRRWTKIHFCGGSIISVNIVLTAAHCMFINNGVINPSSFTVVGGIIQLKQNTNTRQEKNVKTIKIHPKFDMNTLYNDVAVLQLAEPFTLTPELHNVALPQNPPVPKTLCQVSGWGYPESGNATVSNDLMYVDLPIRSTKDCRKLLVNVTDLPAGMFCAGYLAGGKDACQGDSGGGMICNGILTGVVSGGQGCALPLLPGVYADIFHYLDWIVQNENVIIVKQIVDNCTDNNHSTSITPTILVVMISFFFVLLSITLYS
ncbi:trypsin alpha-like [Nylanderia fulva]|uniref:trypsin alpha-like n=1 Tax=Nylanderia fulva TaxID=613905 RepID=UPI0010FAF7AF|nr:trypsin alpha-like [Nylanderia fulva]